MVPVEWKPHSEKTWIYRVFEYLKKAGLSLCLGVLSEYGLNYLNMDSQISQDIALNISSFSLGTFVGESYVKKDREAFIVSGILYLMMNAFWLKVIRKK